jgi:hypothetical protein
LIPGHNLLAGLVIVKRDLFAVRRRGEVAAEEFRFGMAFSADEVVHAGTSWSTSAATEDDTPEEKEGSHLNHH